MLCEINALRCGHIFLHRLWPLMIQKGCHQLYNELESGVIDVGKDGVHSQT